LTLFRSSSLFKFIVQDYRIIFFCIVFVYCTVTNLAVWLQETNKVLLTHLPIAKVKGHVSYRLKANETGLTEESISGNTRKRTAVMEAVTAETHAAKWSVRPRVTAFKIV